MAEVVFRSEIEDHVMIVAPCHRREFEEYLGLTVETVSRQFAQLETTEF